MRSNFGLRRRLIAAGTLAAVAVLSEGCGATGGPQLASNQNARQLVTPAEVTASPPGSPTRALLAWWRAIQYADLTGYLAGFDTPLRRLRAGNGSGDSELTVLSSQLATARPVVVGTTAGHDTATVFTVVTQRAPLGARAFTTTDVPQAFAMVHEHGGWRLGDDTFVLDRVGSVLDRQPNQPRAGVPARAPLPSMIGLRLSVARIELFDLGLVPQADSSADGPVTSQMPAPGAVVARGALVRLGTG